VLDLVVAVEDANRVLKALDARLLERDIPVVPLVLDVDHARASAARRVFSISMAMVIGPTPRGTGVMHEATSQAGARPRPDEPVAALRGGILYRFTPTSMRRRRS
jgi:hypothetical protein